METSIVFDIIQSPLMLSLGACLIFNMILNGYLIYSGLGRIFVMAVLFRIIGSLILAMPCVFFFQFSVFTIDNNQLVPTIFFSLLLSVASWFVNSRRVYSTDDYNNQAYLCHTPDDFTFWLMECLSWAFYLLPYEFLLRGLMLSFLLEDHNIFSAFSINAFVYALVHLHKGVRESLAAFLFGLLLCAITLFTENFWSAYFIHLALAVSNSFIAIKRYSLTQI